MKRGLNIHIKFTNRFLYTFIAFVFVLIIGVGVFAYGTSNPSTFGHSSGELEEADPTVIASVKDGVSWDEVSGIPAGFADGTDDVGITSETDPTVIASVKDGVSWDEVSSKPTTATRWPSWSEISSIPAGFADGVDNVGGITDARCIETVTKADGSISCKKMENIAWGSGCWTAGCAGSYGTPSACGGGWNDLGVSNHCSAITSTMGLSTAGGKAYFYWGWGCPSGTSGQFSIRTCERQGGNR